MKREARQCVILLFVAVALAIVPAPASINHEAMSPQGKGGTIKPVPTPTPRRAAPKRSNPTGSRANSGNQSAKPKEDEAKATERTYWESIKNSNDPEDFRAYLRSYPNGVYADLARNRLNAIETAVKAEAARREEALRKEEEIRKEEAKRKEDEAKKAEAKRKEEEAKKRPGAVVKNGIGMELVWIPPGSFMMGSEQKDYEKPVHQVTLREGFYMGKYEVTQAQWRALMPDNPSDFKGDNLPVQCVSWNDTQEFIARLNEMNDGYVYRLPSEAEWEYACRAGTTGDYAGDLDAIAWYARNSGDKLLKPSEAGFWQMESNNNRPRAVGTKQPNAFGLYDMQGNVAEWCMDYWHENYQGAPTDGSAWVKGGEQEYRVTRTPSWRQDPRYLRSASRWREVTDTRYKYGPGFRLVAVPRT